MDIFFRSYAADALHIPIDELLALGRQNPQGNSEPFNMALLAMRGSGAVNGVSRLHGQVSRGIFHNIFPRWPEAEVPVGHVTNGVHVPVWDSDHSDELWTEVCGKRPWTTHLKPDDLIRELGCAVRQVSDVRLWQMRSASRKSLVDYIRRQLARQIAGHGGLQEEITAAQRVFEPDTLTIGFARRFATYKRPNLLLHDPERLLAILQNKEKPVQLVIAGKAHPQDGPGQEMIQRWIEFIRRGPARSQVVFLSDYDMRMAEHLVQGVDLWLNTPRRPWEACGTSGMKVLVNGGLNLSELDGWWAEAYSNDVGWALGDGLEHGDDPAWDAKEAEQLYTLLEQEVIPEFYKRDNSGIPAGWIARVRESMARLTPAFSATRCVLEYTAKYYLPLAAAYLRRTNDSGKVRREPAAMEASSRRSLVQAAIRLRCTSRAPASSITSIFRSIWTKWIPARSRWNSTPMRPMATSLFGRSWFAANRWSARMSGATPRRFPRLVRQRISRPGSSLFTPMHLSRWRRLTFSGTSDSARP